MKVVKSSWTRRGAWNEKQAENVRDKRQINLDTISMFRSRDSFKTLAQYYLAGGAWASGCALNRSRLIRFTSRTCRLRTTFDGTEGTS